MSNKEIRALLHEYSVAKARVKALRVEMQRFAVEEMGYDQGIAQQMDLSALLEGFLVGQGEETGWEQAA